MPAGRDRRSGRGALEERAFHRWLSRALPWGSRPLLPLGDDAAALLGPRGSAVVVSTDALLEGTHFLKASRPEEVGRAAVAVGLSDIASKGAVPAAVLLALQMPPGTPSAWAERLLTGAERFAASFCAHVVGGDTKAGPTRAVVGTVLGWGDPTRLVPRSGARPGDVLVTTGTVGSGGAASIGLALKGAARTRAVSRLLAVRPRVAEGRALARFAHAMLDTSDGLAEGAHLLAEASGHRIEVDEELLPWDLRLARLPAERRRTLGFYGGDYELLASMPENRVDRARRALARLGTPLGVIGAVRRGRGAYLRQSGRFRPMPHTTWQPFR